MFKIGDVVRLKNGLGPLMTIDYAEEDVVNCIWFSTKDEIQEFRFQTKLLELVKE